MKQFVIKYDWLIFCVGITLIMLFAGREPITFSSILIKASIVLICFSLTFWGYRNEDSKKKNTRGFMEAGRKVRLLFVYKLNTEKQHKAATLAKAKEERNNSMVGVVFFVAILLAGIIVTRVGW